MMEEEKINEEKLYSSRNCYIVFQHYQFPIRDPYKEGQVMTELEANVLNWHRAGLIQKTIQRWVSEVITGGDEILPMETLDKLEAKIKEFDDNYELAPRKPPRKSVLEYNLEQVAYGYFYGKGEFEPTEEDLEKVKRTPEVQARARDLIKSSIMSIDELLTTS